MWTFELIADLERLWKEGASTAEIGRKLGCSKNAVVGKAHRLGLPPRPSPIRRSTVTVASFSGPVCQWPVGDPRSPSFHFCGEPAVAGKPYCASHCATAYTRGSQRAA